MSTSHATAMARLRRVCSGDTGPDVLPPPTLEDQWGVPMRPSPLVEHEGSRNYIGTPNCDTFIRGGGPWPEWVIMALVGMALVAAITVGREVIAWWLP